MPELIAALLNFLLWLASPLVSRLGWPLAAFAAFVIAFAAWCVWDLRRQVRG